MLKRQHYEATTKQIMEESNVFSTPQREEDIRHN
jgi:hypothetical protein